MSTRGQAALEVEEVYGQAYLLCQRGEETDQLLPVLAGLRRFSVVRGAHHKAWELGERLLALAQRLGNQIYQLEAHRARGISLFFRGQFLAALKHLQPLQLFRTGRPEALAPRKPLSRNTPLSCTACPDRATLCCAPLWQAATAGWGRRHRCERTAEGARRKGR
jgi:hypothetical protein